MRRSIATICLLAIAVIGGAYAQAPAAPAAGQAATEPATGDRWPKTAQLDGATYTIYQPQLDSWDSFNMAAHAAVSVKPPGDEDAGVRRAQGHREDESRQAGADRLLQRLAVQSASVSVGAELGGELPAGVPVAVRPRGR